MRYLVQFVIPALIFLGVVYAVTRRKRQPSAESEDSAAVFLTILVIGAVIAVATLFVLQVNWNSL
jgi:Zn-dependent protease with chaperone function